MFAVLVRVVSWFSLSVVLVSAGLFLPGPVVASAGLMNEPECGIRLRAAVDFLHSEGFANQVRERHVKRWIRDLNWVSRAEEASTMIHWLESHSDTIYEELAEVLDRALPDQTLPPRERLRDRVVNNVLSWLQSNLYGKDVTADSAADIQIELRQVLEKHADATTVGIWVAPIASALLPRPVLWDNPTERDVFVRARLEQYLDRFPEQGHLSGLIAEALTELFAGEPIALLPSAIEQRLSSFLDARGVFEARRIQVLRATCFAVWDPEREPHSSNLVRKRIAAYVDRQLSTLIQEKIEAERTAATEAETEEEKDSSRNAKAEPRQKPTSMFTNLPTPPPTPTANYTAQIVPEDVESQRALLARMTLNPRCLANLEEWFFRLKPEERRPFVRVMMQLQASTQLRPRQITGIKTVQAADSKLWEIKPGKTRIRIYFGIGKGGARLINGSDQAKSSPGNENRLIREASELWAAHRAK